MSDRIHKYTIALVVISIVAVNCEVMHGEDPAASSAASLRTGPRLSGFLDVRGVYSNQTDNRNQFMIGQAEIDLEQQIAANVSCLMAVAYNSDNGAFELGAAELHLTLHQDSTTYFRNAQLIAGQFDVPFGIDYRYYASPDCETVCSPWFTHHVGNWSGWNDHGVQLEATSSLGSLDLYLVNGYEESNEIVHSVFNLATGVTEDSVEVVLTTPEAAIGGRVGIAPEGKNVEFGMSASIGFDNRGATAMTLLGSDITYEINRLGFRSEIIYSSISGGQLNEIGRSFYLQAHYQLAPLRLTARYATVREGDENWQRQFSTGIAFAVAKGTELRGEVVRTPGHKVVGLLQIVAGF